MVLVQAHSRCRIKGSTLITVTSKSGPEWIHNIVFYYHCSNYQLVLSYLLRKTRAVEPGADKRWPMAYLPGPWLLHDSLSTGWISGQHTEYVRGGRLHTVLGFTIWTLLGKSQFKRHSIYQLAQAKGIWWLLYQNWSGHKHKTAFSYQIATSIIPHYPSCQSYWNYASGAAFTLQQIQFIHIITAYP